jgi:hypothetical protein
MISRASPSTAGGAREVGSPRRVHRGLSDEQLGCCDAPRPDAKGAVSRAFAGQPGYSWGPSNTRPRTVVMTFSCQLRGRSLHSAMRAGHPNPVIQERTEESGQFPWVDAAPSVHTGEPRRMHMSLDVAAGRRREMAPKCRKGLSPDRQWIAPRSLPRSGFTCPNRRPMRLDPVIRA